MRNFTFLGYIRGVFGFHVANKLKKCMNTLKLIVHTQIRIKFLKCCIRHDLVPSHLYYLQARHLQFYSQKYNNLFNRFNGSHILHILRLELRDSYSFLHALRYDFCILRRTLFYLLLINIINRFFHGQERRNERVWKILNSKILNKVDCLILKRNIALRSKISPIRFSTTDTNNKQIKVDISQDEFGSSATLDDIHDKWFINLSGHNIPVEVVSLLQLGDRFNLPLTNKKTSSFEIIKSIEKNIDRKDEYTQNAVRSDTIPLICDMQRHLDNNIVDKTLKNWAYSTKNFINNNKDIIFTRADKGNTTVALNKMDYLSKMDVLLSDRSTYEMVRRDPTRKITDSLRSLLSRWKSKGYIDDFTYRCLNSTDGLLPRAYGLPKIHKLGYPLRIIISSIDSPLYSLANFLHHIIHKSLSHTSSYLKNSFDLVKKLKHTQIDSDYHLASLDVISLFTNIPLDMANTSIKRRWNFIRGNTVIPEEEFLIGINLVLNSTFFVFNKVFYKQIFGTPMGSPLSPIIADIVMQDLEELAIKRLPCTIPLYFRYVDDVLLAAKENEYDNILQTFNSIHERLQFTIEKSTHNCINFLNVNILLKENSFTFDLYYKPSFSYRYLNFFSHHPLVHKKSVITGLVDKVIYLSDPKFYSKNLKFIISILLDNCYPLDLIFSTVRKRIKTLFYSCNASREKNNNMKYFPIPYVKCISERLVSVLKKHDYTAAFYCNNNLQKFIKTGKDCLDPMNQCGVVYRISCQNCDATYVGQTKRQLRTRIKEHRSDINKKTGSPSVISAHKLELSHDFFWKDVEILDKENSYNKRLISEMIHIKRQTNSLNKQLDTDLFPDSYLTVLNLFPSL